MVLGSKPKALHMPSKCSPLGYISTLHYPPKRETPEGSQRNSHMVKEDTELTPAGWSQESPQSFCHLNLFITKSLPKTSLMILYWIKVPFLL